MEDNHTEAYISWYSEFLLMPKGSASWFFFYLSAWRTSYAIVGEALSHAQSGIVFLSGSIVLAAVAIRGKESLCLGFAIISAIK